MGRDREDLWLCDQGVKRVPMGVSEDPTLSTTPPAFLFSSLFRHSLLLNEGGDSLVIIALRMARALRSKQQTLFEAKNI